MLQAPVRPAFSLLPFFQVLINRPSNQFADCGASLFGQLGQGLVLMLAEIDVGAFHRCIDTPYTERVSMVLRNRQRVCYSAMGSKLVALAKTRQSHFLATLQIACFLLVILVGGKGLEPLTSCL